VIETARPPLASSEQSRYYREKARALRARVYELRDEESINQFYLLATHYERLADFADSVERLG
jgi:hypothetical protein